MTFASQSLGQRLSFLRLPSTISSIGSTPLDANELEPLIANLVGIPTELSRSGLSTYSTLDRPKANLLFVVEDFVESPKDLGFKDDGVQFEGADASDVFDSFQELDQIIQKSFKGSPLLLHNFVEDKQEATSSDSGDVNSALAKEQNLIEELNGAMKMSQLLNASPLNVTSPPDRKFLSELSLIQNLIDALDFPAVKPLVNDFTPDLFLFRFRSLKGIVDAYGRDSPQVEKMKAVLKEFIETSTAKVGQVYGDKITVELITLPSGGEEQQRRRRAAADAAASAAASVKGNNIASPYKWSYAATFNMCIWTGVILAAVLYLIAFSMWNMDPGRDGYVYRMTMSKNK